MIKNWFMPLSLPFIFLFLLLITDFSMSWPYMLILLTSWIFGLMILSMKPFSLGVYTLLLGLLFILLLLTFSSSSLISFYIFFESSLIPTLFLIMGWGYQPERLPSSLYFLFYTLVASLPLLFIILGMNYEYQSTLMPFLPVLTDSIFSCFLILAFLVKLPIYFGHIWLPKAHVEAPVTGSMVLAAILLKLGGFGLFLVQTLFYDLGYSLVLTIGLLGGIFSSILSLRQTDVKALIAYSSVAHMSFVIVSMMLSNIFLNLSSIYMMIAHGICSSGLFYLSYLIYLRVSSRSFMLTRGILIISPYLCLWWFLLIVFNMGVPPSFNLFAELYMFAGVSPVSLVYLALAGLISFFSACYCLYLYSSTSHGLGMAVTSFSKINLLELSVCSLHFIPLLYLISI